MKYSCSYSSFAKYFGSGVIVRSSSSSESVRLMNDRLPLPSYIYSLQEWMHLPLLACRIHGKTMYVPPYTLTPNYSLPPSSAICSCVLSRQHIWNLCCWTSCLPLGHKEACQDRTASWYPSYSFYHEELPHSLFSTDAHGHQHGGHAAHGPEGLLVASESQRQKRTSDVESLGTEKTEHNPHQHGDETFLDAGLAHVLGIAILEFGVVLHRCVLSVCYLRLKMQLSDDVILVYWSDWPSLSMKISRSYSLFWFSIVRSLSISASSSHHFFQRNLWGNGYRLTPRLYEASC